MNGEIVFDVHIPANEPVSQALIAASRLALSKCNYATKGLKLLVQPVDGDFDEARVHCNGHGQPLEITRVVGDKHAIFCDHGLKHLRIFGLQEPARTIACRVKPEFVSLSFELGCHALVEPESRVGRRHSSAIIATLSDVSATDLRLGDVHEVVRS